MLWKLRNTALHGVTFTESEATRRTRVEPLVRQLYNRIYEVNPSDRVMFTKPLDERLKQPMSIIETWLSLIQPAFDAALTDDTRYLPDRSDDPSEARPTLGVWFNLTLDTTSQPSRSPNITSQLACIARPVCAPQLHT